MAQTGLSESQVRAEKSARTAPDQRCKKDRCPVDGGAAQRIGRMVACLLGGLPTRQWRGLALPADGPPTLEQQ